MKKQANRKPRSDRRNIQHPKRWLALLTVTFSLGFEVVAQVASASHFPIETMAGGGDRLGDGGLAVDAIVAPSHSVRDAQGNVYIAEAVDHRIRKVDPAGIITTIAGNGTPGFSGDGGQATLARLNTPYGVELDGSGNLFIADSLNHRIRKVTPTGVITTVAGGSGNFGEGIPATQAGLYTPYRVTYREGNLFISDTGTHRIRKVDTQGIINTFAGSVSGFSGDGGPATAAKFNLPWKIAFDTSGNAFIADAANQRIRKVDPQGTITTFAGTGVAGFSGDGSSPTQTSFYHPVDITFDDAGAMLVADLDNWRVRKVTSDLVTTFAGGGQSNESGIPATSVYLGRVWGAFFSGGSAFISSANKVRRVDGTGIIWTFAGGGAPCFGGDGGPARAARLCGPKGATEDAQGNLYIADSDNRRVRRVSGGNISTIAGDGRVGDAGDGGPGPNASFLYPVAVLPDDLGGVYVVDSGSSRVRYLDPSGIIRTVAGTGQGGYSGDGGPATAAALRYPTAIAIGPDGDLYIADTDNHRIRRVRLSDGVIMTVAGDGTAGYHGDRGSAVDAGLSSPKGVAVDGRGAIYIADTTNGRIRKVTPGGNIYTIAGGDATSADTQWGSFAAIYPTAITVDGEGIRVIFTDEPRHAVRQIDGYGRASFLTGGNGQGFSGDGGAAVNAKLNGPNGVFLTGDGSVLVADRGNNRIRKFQIDPPTNTERDASKTRTSIQELPEHPVVTTAKGTKRQAEETAEAVVEDVLTTISDTKASAALAADEIVSPTKRVSTNDLGTQCNGRSDQARISGDGRHVAFVSSGTNLVPTDLNGSTQDVFVKDRLTGQTVLASVATAGGQANYLSIQPSISADGRFVAFRSAATNLVADDSNGLDDVFLRDRDTDMNGRFDEPGLVSTMIISVAPGSVPGDGESGHPSLSPNGRYLAFASLATNLVVADTNAMADVFLRDLELGTTMRVSVGVGEGNGHSIWPSVSDDGTVAFESLASNLVTGDSNGVLDIFVGSSAGTTARVSLRSDGLQASLDSSWAAISGNGGSVAFHTASSGMVPADQNGVSDVFLRDLLTGELKLVSVGVGGISANGVSASPALSWDGRLVSFGSLASNLVANDLNQAGDVFVIDMEFKTTRRASVGSQLSESNGLSLFGSISYDGSRVAFQSDASNLVDNDSNGVTDIFVRSLPA